MLLITSEKIFPRGYNKINMVETPSMQKCPISGSAEVPCAYANRNQIREFFICGPSIKYYLLEKRRSSWDRAAVR